MASGGLMEQTLLRIDDREAFNEGFAREPVAVRHSLVDHPLLTLESIAELADSLPLASIERHRADLPVVVPGGAPDVEGPPSETVRGIETNGCWMVLWYLEQDPAYRALLDAVLDEAEAHISGRGGGMQRREAFLFLSAPNAVTPVHFDPEHNFLLQIRGAKDMNVCAWDDPETEQRELNRYHDGGHRNLDVMPRESKTFRLNPGDGVYVPPWRPHWVQNQDAVSISLSITFRTAVSERGERVHMVNSRLRRLHLSPRPPGSSRRVDRAKEIAYVLVNRLKGTRPSHKG
jgi:cupin superfamily protein